MEVIGISHFFFFTLSYTGSIQAQALRRSERKSMINLPFSNQPETQQLIYTGPASHFGALSKWDQQYLFVLGIFGCDEENVPSLSNSNNNLYIFFLPMLPFSFTWHWVRKHSHYQEVAFHKAVKVKITRTSLATRGKTPNSLNHSLIGSKFQNYVLAIFFFHLLPSHTQSRLTLQSFVSKHCTKTTATNGQMETSKPDSAPFIF